MAIPTITVTPGTAARAYGEAQSGFAGSGGGDFGGVLGRVLGGVVEAGRQADAQSMQAIAGGGNLTELIGAVSKAELALQTTTAIRDRVVQAYQDIMRMPI